MASKAPPVAKGGLFGAADRPGYSKQTHDLLKVMMEESRLTNFQRRKLQESLKDGRSLPTRVAPTSSEQKMIKIAKKSPKKDGISRNMRTRERIEQSGAYEREQYIPKPIRSLDREKERLSNMMAYGEDIDRKPRPKIQPPVEPDPPKDRFEEIQEEIVERREFLNQMERLGQGKNHRSVINTQISQLIREMEMIDNQRTAALQKAIEEEELENEEG